MNSSMSIHIIETVTSSKIAMLDIKTILVYYAIGCLILLPFYAIFIIYLCKKKPHYIKRLNNRIDMVLGIESQEEKKDDKEQELTEESEEESKSIEEQNEEMNISNLFLKVGDTYKCNITEWDINQISGSRYIWGSTDEFVAPIDAMTGMLQAEKIGECFIECGEKRIYYVKVLPNDTDWFGNRILELVLGNMDKENLAVSFIKNRITVYDESSRTIGYEVFGSPSMVMLFEYNKKNEIVRVVIKTKHSQAEEDDIVKHIGEYMSPVKLDRSQKTETKYWNHYTNNSGIKTIDYNAFLKKGKDGYLYFGIGECWRIGADENEIASNPEMIERSFKNLLPSSEIPEQVKTTAKVPKPSRSRKASKPEEEKDERPTVPEKNDAEEQDEEATENASESEETPQEDYVPNGGAMESYDEDSDKDEEESEDSSYESSEEKPDDGGPADPFDDYNENNENDIDVNENN